MPRAMQEPGHAPGLSHGTVSEKTDPPSPRPSRSSGPGMAYPLGGGRPHQAGAAAAGRQRRCAAHRSGHEERPVGRGGARSACCPWRCWSSFPCSAIGPGRALRSPTTELVAPQMGYIQRLFYAADEIGNAVYGRPLSLKQAINAVSEASGAPPADPGKIQTFQNPLAALAGPVEGRGSRLV